MVLYHGSENIIEKPSFYKGNPHNDYGKGFYCTENPDLAKEWACKNDSDGFINKYEFDYNNLKTLDLTDNSLNVVNWIAILLKNRIFDLEEPVAIEAREYIIDNFSLPTEKYDIVYGYRADDSYFRYAQSFVSNGLSVRVLSNALYLGNLGMQTTIISKKAFSQIKFIGAEFVEKEVYYQKFAKRDADARRTYKRMTSSGYSVKDDIYVMDIIRQGIKNDDPRLRRILCQ